jgi:hypothetical protein
MWPKRVAGPCVTKVSRKMLDYRALLPSFDTDGCIIEEQKDHLVVALRIPKSVIADNLHLFVELADRADVRDAPWSPALDPPKPPRNKIRNRSILAAICGTFLVAPAIPGISLAGPPAPIEYRDREMEKPVFKVGEPLRMRMQYHRTRACSTEIEWSISQDGVSVYSTREPGIVTQPNSSFKEIGVVLRGFNPGPGSYVYHGMTHSDCAAAGGIYETPHEDVSFKVVE